MNQYLKGLFSLLAFPLFGISQSTYHYSIDIKNIADDRVAVQLQCPAIKESEVIFSFPKAIPGSYSQKDYGRFIDNFSAKSLDGKSLSVKKLNANQFKIKNATTLSTISYKVNDTWDDEDGSKFIFQPGGSNIDEGKNVVLNNHAFFGYFEGYKMLPFEINVTRPTAFYASTNLPVERKPDDHDLLKADNYVFLADNPVFYCQPDTTSFLVGNSRINVSVYSSNKKVTSGQVAGYLKPMSVALQKFFNGLPVRSYQFLYFFEDDKVALTGKKRGGYGALEHNYSSLYFLPESSYEPGLKSMVNEVSSHEFLHILTPLNLHSEEIENFDFTNPKMSQHLWLYEGVTEYFANLVQLQNGLLTEKQFITNMRHKMIDAEKLGSFSMTEMSKNVLTDKYQDKYSSVYNKGALIAFMLDLFIREKTQNQKDLKSVIQQLAQKYGPQKPFEDDVFFTEFVNASHPDVQQFINEYIVGEKPLPFNDLLASLGYEYQEEVRKNVYFAGNMGLAFNEDNHTFNFTHVEKNALGIKDDDVFLSVNDQQVTSENLDEVWENYFKMNTSLQELKLVVRRSGTEKILSGPLYKGYVQMKKYIGPVENPTGQQKSNLDQFLGKQ